MANTFLDRLAVLGSGGFGVGPLVGVGVGGFGLAHLSGKLKDSFNSDKITSSVGLLGSNNADSVPHASIFDGINNSLTGNLDFQRELEMLKQNQLFNAEQARLQREFEEYMSSTAFSRQAEDLLRAGYNPALVLSNGGASTPSGYAASSSGSHFSQSSSTVNSLVNALVNLSLNSARSNEALSAARLLDEKAELIRESSNAKNNYYNSRTRLNNEKFVNYNNEFNTRNEYYNSRTRLNNEKFNNLSKESKAFVKSRNYQGDYYREKAIMLKRHNSYYQNNASEENKKNLKKNFDVVYNRLKRR